MNRQHLLDCEGGQAVYVYMYVHMCTCVHVCVHAHASVNVLPYLSAGHKGLILEYIIFRMAGMGIIWRV